MRIIKTPLSNEVIESLNAGDIVYLEGMLYTGRDDVHHRLLKQKRSLPVDLKGMALFHAGPIVKDTGGGYEIVSIGPTTSMRMEKYEEEFMRETGVKMIIGKGGMGNRTVEGCMEYKAVHAVFPGGCAVLAAECVEGIDRVEWLDLGMPEAIWSMRVKAFGPLIISIDTKGNNLFENNKTLFERRKNRALEEIYGNLDYHD